MSDPNFNHLWSLESAFVDCTHKQYREFVLKQGDAIIVAGRYRQLTYRKIAPGVIRVFKSPDDKCPLCGAASKHTDAASRRGA